MAKDIPIIFSAPMVRALLEGRKTMTRRIIKLPTKGEYVRPDMGGWAPTTVGGGASFTIRRDGTREPYPERVAIWNQTTGTCIAARYQPGDRLWVRENFKPVHSGDPNQGARYRADLGCDDTIWRPSIHMSRWASRLTLIVSAIKIERVQDISLLDVWAEGCEVRQFWLFGADGPERQKIGARVYGNLWEELHGRESWDQNPFVVAITFRVIKANIDAPEARVAA